MVCMRVHSSQPEAQLHSNADATFDKSNEFGLRTLAVDSGHVGTRLAYGVDDSDLLAE